MYIKVEELLVDMRRNLNDLDLKRVKRIFISRPKKKTFFCLFSNTYLIVAGTNLIRTVTVADEMQIQDFPHLFFVPIKHREIKGIR